MCFASAGDAPATSSPPSVVRSSRRSGTRVAPSRTISATSSTRPFLDAVHPEVTADQAYLAGVRAEFESAGTKAETVLAFGEPADEIVKWIREKGCDLVAMSTHGHRFFGDLFLGTTASRVQHKVSVPVLLLRAR